MAQTPIATQLLFVIGIRAHVRSTLRLVSKIRTALISSTATKVNANLASMIPSVPRDDIALPANASLCSARLIQTVRMERYAMSHPFATSVLALVLSVVAAIRPAISVMSRIIN